MLHASKDEVNTNSEETLNKQSPSLGAMCTVEGAIIDFSPASLLVVPWWWSW